MKLLDRYIFREFALALAGVVGFCSLLIIVGMIFENFQDMIDNKTPLDKAALFFLCSVPNQLIQIIPIAVTLAVLFSIGALARNNEILAFTTNGVTPLRVAIPIIFGGVLVVGGIMWASETAIPRLQQYAHYLDNRYVRAKSEQTLSTEDDVFARGQQNRIYMMPAYSIRDKRMSKPQIYDMAPGYAVVARRIAADSAQYEQTAKDEASSRWVFANASVWTFDADGNLASFETTPSLALDLEPDLAGILEQRKDPEEMNFRELKQHIERLRERGQPANEFMTDLILKITFPAGTLFVMLIGFSFAVRSRAGSATSAMGAGIVWAFAYYGFNAVMRALGHAESLPATVAAASGCVIFAALAIAFFRRSQRWYA